jgi:hypothetical protein
VLAHPSYKADPFAAIRQHLEATMPPAPPPPKRPAGKKAKKAKQRGGGGGVSMVE